jgi:hypothetical protein
MGSGGKIGDGRRKSCRSSSTFDRRSCHSLGILAGYSSNEIGHRRKGWDEGWMIHLAYLVGRRLLIPGGGEASLVNVTILAASGDPTATCFVFESPCFF